VLTAVNLLFAGLLAGAEVVVRFGVRNPLRVLDQVPQIRLRQALIRTLRLLVPALALPTVATGIAVTLLDGSTLRWAGTVAALAWMAVTFGGTVPLNSALIEWDAERPPEDWRAVIRKWERLDTARAVAAVLTFGCFLIASELLRPGLSV